MCGNEHKWTYCVASTAEFGDRLAGRNVVAQASDQKDEATEPLLWRLTDLLTDLLRDLVRADLACADCERSTTLLFTVLSLL